MIISNVRISNCRCPKKTALRVDPLKQYMVEVSKYKLLPADEQKNLAILFKEKNEPEAKLLIKSKHFLSVKYRIFKISRGMGHPYKAIYDREIKCDLYIGALMVAPNKFLKLIMDTNQNDKQYFA